MRRGFLRLSRGLQRKSVADHPDSRRSTGGRKAPSKRNIIPKQVAMNRRDPVSVTEIDHMELDSNCFREHHHLKLNNSNGVDFSKNRYLFTRNGTKGIKPKPTRYWSKNWPSDEALASMCNLEYLYVVPDCFDDERNAFLSAEEMENNFVEVIHLSSSSSSSST